MDSSRVAWECVPSHEEILAAVDQCLARGVDHPVLRRYAPGRAAADRLRRRFLGIDWPNVPAPIAAAVRELASGPVLTPWAW